MRDVRWFGGSKSMIRSSRWPRRDGPCRASGSWAILGECLMSNPVRVAFVMEGPTDYVVLRAAVRALLAGRDFEPTSIWPELDENLRPKTEGGWGGVYKWR